MIRDWIVLGTGFGSFTAYVAYILIMFGVIRSISASDYLLKKPFRYWFELTMFISGLTIAYSGWHIMNENILMVVGGGFIFGVGLFPDFEKNLFNRIMHYILAIGGFTLVLVSFWIHNEQWYLTVLAALLSTLAYIWPKRNKIFYLEIEMSYFIFAGLIFNMLIK